MLKFWNQVSRSTFSHLKPNSIFPYCSVKINVLGQNIDNTEVINQIQYLPQTIETIEQKALEYNFFQEFEENEDTLILYNGILECRNKRHEVARRKRKKRKSGNNTSIRWK